MGPFGRFFQQLGYTMMFDNPDSWEGWHWGATHTWGYWWRLGNLEQFDLLEDALKNTEEIIFWAVDPNTSGGVYAGQETTPWRYWCKDLGIKMVFIDPWCNYTASLLSDKWLAPRPGTDAAMAEAIAYVWIKEGTYDKWFVENRTTGFEEFKKQSSAKKDGTRPDSGMGIGDKRRAHPRYRGAGQGMGRQTTMLGTCSTNGQAGASRQAYATEWARLMVFLIAMQGLGKPGVNVWSGAAIGGPLDFSFNYPGYSSFGWDTFRGVAKKPVHNKVTQKCYRLLLPETIMNPPVSWIGEGFCGFSIDQQFKPYTCPEPGPNGSEIKMFYRHGGSFISTMTDTNRWVKMYQHPNLEFVVNQDCHWQSETSFADIILPACTNFERTDIAEWANGGGYAMYAVGLNHRIIVYQKKCIEPLWESKPDYDIYAALAHRLGFGDEYTEGNTAEDWIKKVFPKTSPGGVYYL